MQEIGGDVRADVERPHIVKARANWGRWIIECFTPWCTNAWMPELGQDEWLCTVCGLATQIEWPPDPIAIEALLLMRPDPNTRNWEPGETLEDLLMENAAHGILPEGAPDDLSEPGQHVLMDIANGHVVGGLVYGPIEQWRAIRGSNPSITAAGEPRAYRQLEV